MRHVIVSMNVTIDGFMSGQNNELDWHFQSWDAEMSKSATEQLKDADTILFGGITYRAMAAFCTLDTPKLGIAREDIAFYEMLDSHTKIVFSKTLSVVTWKNSRLVKDGIVPEIVRLKRKEGKDILVYGSGEIVYTLVHRGLVDEFRVWVHPVMLGAGRRLFTDLSERLSLKLIRTKIFDSGVVLFFYQPLKKRPEH